MPDECCILNMASLWGKLLVTAKALATQRKPSGAAGQEGGGEESWNPAVSDPAVYRALETVARLWS